MQLKHLATSLISLVACTIFAAAERQIIPINENWQFRFAHQVSGAGEVVNLPHTWNAGDALSGKPDYYRGMGIYEKTLEFQPEWANKRVYLRFEGANEVATVFINSHFAGEHKGGYSAFVIDITDFLIPHNKNTVTVKVTNALNLEIMPLVGDFNMYGGLYRAVNVITVDSTHISLTDYASPGVYLTQRNVNQNYAEVNATVKVTNTNPSDEGMTLKISVLDQNNMTVGQEQQDFIANADTTVNVDFTISIKKPHLWDGKNDPYMYLVRSELIGSDGKIIDAVDQSLGLRYFSVDADNGFSLNGKPLRLRGVCRHQDRAERGNALLWEHHAEDAALIEEIGANAVRLAHYPQAEEFYSLMDRSGIIVWAEIPFIGPGGYHDRGFNNIQEFKENGRQQLLELIRQNYNHPSICFWGLFNELKTYGDSPYEYVYELNGLAHAEDSGRLTTAASFLSASDSLNSITDLIAWNQYFGWYGGYPSDLGKWLDSTHAKFPEYRIGLSEYGAGASVYHQQDSVAHINASGHWHPEGFQTDYHIKSWKELATRPYVWGSFVWNMFDFGAAHRNEGDRPGINDKGLVTFDRKTKKDAFYFYKANWNDNERFVHIAEKRNLPHKASPTTITVFSNEPEVKLFVNGELVGSLKSDGFGTFRFLNVMLKSGENVIEAHGSKGVTDRTIFGI